jgi:heptosyltransferase-2
VYCNGCEYYEADTSIREEFPPKSPPDPESNNDAHKRIIIVKLDAVGDVLRTTSILPSLKEKYPDSAITWITKDRSYEVLKDNDLIDEIYFSTDELSHIYNDVFDIAINLDSGSESCAIMSEISAKEQFGYYLANSKPYPVNTLASEWYLMGVNDNFKKENKKTYHQIIHEICGLKYNGSQPYLGVPIEKVKCIKQIKEKFALHKFNEFNLVNLGGGNRWQYKKWTKEGYIELIDRLSSSSPKAAVGLVAGDEDRDFYQSVVDSIIHRDNILYFGCDNTIENFICIIQLADKIITSDSLAFHIATALSKYVIVLVGPTSHTELDVFERGKIIYSTKVDCLCCYLNKCDKTITCMGTLTAAEIIENLDK